MNKQLSYVQISFDKNEYENNKNQMLFIDELTPGTTQQAFDIREKGKTKHYVNSNGCIYESLECSVMDLTTYLLCYFKTRNIFTTCPMTIFDRIPEVIHQHCKYTLPPLQLHTLLFIKTELDNLDLNALPNNALSAYAEFITAVQKTLSIIRLFEGKLYMASDEPVILVNFPTSSTYSSDPTTGTPNLSMDCVKAHLGNPSGKGCGFFRIDQLPNIRAIAKHNGLKLKKYFTVKIHNESALTQAKMNMPNVLFSSMPLAWRAITHVAALGGIEAASKEATYIESCWLLRQKAYLDATKKPLDLPLVSFGLENEIAIYNNIALAKRLLTN